MLNTKSASPIQDLSVTQPSSLISGIYKIAVTPAAPQNLYLMNGTVYVSSDDGNIWKEANFPSSGPSQTFSWFSQTFEVSLRDGNIFYVGNDRTWKADLNVSPSFYQITNYGGIINGGDRMHPDIRKIMLLNSGTGEDLVFLGTDGGVSYSDNSGGKFKNINGKGLQITQFYKLGGAEKYPGLILGGCQDVGTKKYENGVWSNIGPFINGDGSECLIDGNNPSTYYYIVNSAVKSPGNTISSPPAPPSAYTGSNMTFHGNNYNAISYSRVDVYETQDQAQSWSPQTTNNQQISCIAVSESNPFVKYYATGRILYSPDPVGSEGIIWKTIDGGNTWQDITAGFDAVQYVICLSVFFPKIIPLMRNCCYH